MSRLAAFSLAVFLGACARPLPEYQKPMARAQFQKVRTTAYTHSESDHLEHGCKTCLGTTLRYGAIRSAAADWSRWPAGTQFRILDTGEVCEVDDIGWALSGRNTIDLYKPSRSAMNAWGVRTVDIEILRWGEDQDSYRILEKRRKHRHVKRMVVDLKKRIDRGATNPVLVASTPPAPVPVAIPATVAVAAHAETAAAPVARMPAVSSPQPGTNQVLRSFRSHPVQ